MYLLTLAVNEAHIKCGVPKIAFSDLGNATPSTIGTFDRTTWHMKLNYEVIGGPASESNFILMAEAVYHEARHAEQHWLITCLASAAIRVMNTGDPQVMQKRTELVKHLSVLPKNITSQAWELGERFDPSPELKKKIKKWYESAYTNRFDYRKALVDIDKNTVNTNPFLNDEQVKYLFREQAYYSYKSSAHEADAFSVQDLVHNKLCQVLMPRGISPPILPAQQNYQSGRDLIVF